MKTSPRISDAEWVVMKILWNRSPLPASEIIDALITEHQAEQLAAMETHAST